MFFSKIVWTLGGGGGEWLLHKQKANCKQDQNMCEEEKEYCNNRTKRFKEKDLNVR